MAIVQQVCVLLVVFWYAIVGGVDGTGQQASVIAVDGIYDGRLQGINVQAVFDMGGVRGYIQFSQKAPGEPVEIHANLEGLDQFADSYPWHVHNFPVRTGLLRDYPCSNAEVDGHYDPLNAFTNDTQYAIDCNPNNPSACEVGDFSNKLGYLRNDLQWQTFVDSELDLYGPYSIIGRSLVIHRGSPPQNRWICANIEYLGARVDIIRASLVGDNQAQGDVIIHKVAGRDDATIYLDVWRNDSLNGARDWQLRRGGVENQVCEEFTTTTYGEQSGVDYSSCGIEKQRECPVGDLTRKCGQIQFVNGRARLFCTDNQLGSIRTSDLVNKQASQPVSVTILQAGAVTACGELEAAQPQVARVDFKNSVINGQIWFYQASPNDRTYARTYVTGLRRMNVTMEIRTGGTGTCASGSLLRKPGSSRMIIGRPVGAVKTGDAVVLGNLSTKLRIPPGSESYRVTTSTPYLPLFGPYSIVGNTLVLTNANGEDLACGLIVRQSAYPSGLAASILGYQNEYQYK